MVGIPFRVVGTVEAQGEMFGMPLNKFAVVPYTASTRRYLCEARNVDVFNVQAMDSKQLNAAVTEA